MNGSNRISDINRLYELLDELARKFLQRFLSSCFEHDMPSSGGVYFFYEKNERRSGSGTSRLRVVRVGQTTNLWQRLSHHKGGNKDSSVFRKLVGFALEEKEESKKPLNERVTETLGQMQVSCLPIEDETLHDSIEHNAIALLSNYHKQPIDPPSEGWLGHHCARPKVQESGLWNQRHVDETYDPAFLDTLERLILNFKGTT